MDKIYCDNCDHSFRIIHKRVLRKYFIIDESVSEYKCGNSINKTKKVSDTWFKYSTYWHYKEDPSEINKNNDCKYYKEGWKVEHNRKMKQKKLLKTEIPTKKRNWITKLLRG